MEQPQSSKKQYITEDGIMLIEDFVKLYNDGKIKFELGGKKEGKNNTFRIGYTKKYNGKSINQVIIGNIKRFTIFHPKLNINDPDSNFTKFSKESENKFSISVNVDNDNSYLNKYAEILDQELEKLHEQAKKKFKITNKKHHEIVKIIKVYKKDDDSQEYVSVRIPVNFMFKINDQVSLQKEELKIITKPFFIKEDDDDLEKYGAYLPYFSEKPLNKEIWDEYRKLPKMTVKTIIAYYNMYLEPTRKIKITENDEFDEDLGLFRLLNWKESVEILKKTQEFGISLADKSYCLSTYGMSSPLSVKCLYLGKEFKSPIEQNKENSQLIASSKKNKKEEYNEDDDIEYDDNITTNSLSALNMVDEENKNDNDIEENKNDDIEKNKDNDIEENKDNNDIEEKPIKSSVKKTNNKKKKNNKKNKEDDTDI